MEPIAGSRGQVFSVAGSPSAGFGVHGTVAERVNSSPKLLGVGEMGVYSSYTHADIAAAKGHWRDYKRWKRQEV